MNSTVRVRVLRAFCVRGEPLEVGAIVSLNPTDAHAVLGVRAELLDPQDRDVIAQAVQEANRAALAAERHRGSLSGPWR